MKCMNRRFGWCTAVALAGLLVAGVPSVTQANGPADVQTSDVFTWDGSTITGTSKLVRTDAGVSVNLETSSLEPGAYTLWFIVFNHPEFCGHEDGCGIAAEDFAVGGPVGFGFSYAAGHVVDETGEATFAGHLNQGTQLLNDNLELDEVLEDPRTAEIHLVVRYHGPADPEKIDEQIRTGEFLDCDICDDVQFAVHPAP